MNQFVKNKEEGYKMCSITIPPVSLNIMDTDGRNRNNFPLASKKSKVSSQHHGIKCWIDPLLASNLRNRKTLTYLSLHSFHQRVLNSKSRNLCLLFTRFCVFMRAFVRVVCWVLVVFLARGATHSQSSQPRDATVNELENKISLYSS